MQPLTIRPVVVETIEQYGIVERWEIAPRPGEQPNGWRVECGPDHFFTFESRAEAERCCAVYNTVIEQLNRKDRLVFEQYLRRLAAAIIVTAGAMLLLWRFT